MDSTLNVLPENGAYLIYYGIVKVTLGNNCYMNSEMIIFLFLAWGLIYGPELSFYNSKCMSAITRSGSPPGIKHSYVFVVSYFVFVYH